MLRKVKILAAVIIVLFSASGAYSAEYGATEIDITQISSMVGTDWASTGGPVVRMQPEIVDYSSPWGQFTDDWNFIANDTITSTIMTGFHLMVSFDPATEVLSITEPPFSTTATQAAAIQRAPRWVRADLCDNFQRFTVPTIADWVAQEILDAPDPYVDEVAFQAAHLSPGLLGGAMYIDLLLYNAELIYGVDDGLNFVDIIDYGASSDDDYYSTTRYNTIDENGDTVIVEIEPEIYYWNVVHPKLSDELPTYIDPANGQSAAPPVGVFWRDYLWNLADSGYVLYNTMWDSVTILWDRGSPDITDAIGTVNSWIGNVMNWGAGAERPIQPVRIYALHCGNCGEYQDIRAAAGRIALIPTICTSNICEDHVWNEFWADDSQEWIHWDGGDINNPLLYENGWGKRLSAVFNYRGDGYIWGCTEMYSSGICTLQVALTDSTGKPADGVKIKVFADFYYGGVYYTTWGVSNSLGLATFLLGDEHDYYIRVEGALGSYPAGSNTYTQIIDNSLPNTAYSWNYEFANASPNFGVTEAEPYQNPLNNYLLEIEYDCTFETMYQAYFSISGIAAQFAYKSSPGLTDVFIANQANFFNYLTMSPAEGFGVTDNSASGQISYILPTAETWNVVFSNRELSVNSPTVQVTAAVYRNSAWSVENGGGSDAPAKYSLSAPYPNPFNAEALIAFTAAGNERITIGVYDISGRRTAVLTNGFYAPGYYNVKWNGMTEQGGKAASGIYFVTMTTGSQHLSQKVCLIK